MKKASIGIAAILAVLFVLAIAISLNLTGGITGVRANGIEICNYADDDDDGLCYNGNNHGLDCTTDSECPEGECILADEDFWVRGAPIGTPCYGQYGVCSEDPPGIAQCFNDTISICSTDPGGWQERNTTEKCDAIDHDCDGDFYNGFEVQGIEIGGLGCYGQYGVCSEDPPGFAQCFNDTISICSTDPGGWQERNTTETCNEVDDDCDNLVDEGGVCTISITLYDYPINFGSLNPGTDDNAGTGNPYKISVDPVTGPNVDLYQEGTDFTYVGNILGIENMAWSTTDDAEASLPFNETYDSDYPIATDVQSDTNITMYYWLNVPGGNPAGSYSATINIKAVQTGTSP